MTSQFFKTSLFVAAIAASILIPGACTTGQAQSITGKWVRKDVKLIAIEKASGKRQDASEEEKQTVQMYKETVEFKPDHTFFWSTETEFAGKPMEMYGTYKFNDNQLSIELDPKLVEQWKKMGKTIKAVYKAFAGEVPKEGKLKDNQPRFIKVKSVTGSSMIWVYDSDVMLEDDEEISKQYHMETEVTYQKL